MPRQLLNLQFPSGGVHKRFAYAKQPPFTTPDARNVRPRSPIEERFTGGQRPGYGPEAVISDPTSTPINMLEHLSYIDKTSKWTPFIDTFKNGLRGEWLDFPGYGAGLTWDETSEQVETVFGATIASYVNLPVKTSTDRMCEVLCVPYQGSFNGRYSLFLSKMDPPQINFSGIEVSLTVLGSAYTGFVTWLANGIQQGSVAVQSGDLGRPDAFWFRVRVSQSTPNTQVFVNELLKFSQDTALYTDTSFALALNQDVTIASASGVQKLRASEFRVQYADTGGPGQVKRNIAVAAYGGKIAVEEKFGYLRTLSINRTVRSDVHLLGAERGQQLFIADWSESIFDDDTTNAAVVSTILTLPGADFLAAGVNNFDFVCRVISSDGTEPGSYVITGVTATTLTLLLAADGDDVVFRVERAPKVLTAIETAPALDTWEATAGLGSVPRGRIIVLWNDRIVMAGDSESPNVWFMSRQGDAYDWDYGADPFDPQRAIAGNNSKAGIPGEIIRALAPHTDSYLVMGCENSLWVMRGDPGGNGVLSNLSSRIGIVSARAWCHGPNGATIFLTKDGIYGLAPGGGQFPESLSRAALPDEMRDIDIENSTILLAFDMRDRGVHIISTPGSGKGQHWWFDWETKTYWPVEFEDNTVQPRSILEYETTAPETSGVWFGDAKGVIRRFRRERIHDEDKYIANYIWVGPIRPAGDEYAEGLIAEIVGAMATLSGPVGWEIWSGNTAEEAFRSGQNIASGTFSETGVNFTEHPRARGAAVWIKLTAATPIMPWAMEKLTIAIEPAGRLLLA